MENQLKIEGGVPTDFCKDKNFKIIEINKIPFATNIACAPCLKVHFPKAIEWLEQNEPFYSRDQMSTSIGQEKLAPYMTFSEKKTLVCVEKDHEYKEGEDLSKY